MGTWGTGLYSNDDALDVRDDLKEMLKYGYATEDAFTQIMDEFDLREPDADNCAAWLALADSAWKCGVLNENIKDIVLKLIGSGVALLGFEGSDIAKRKQVLERLYLQLQQKMPPKKIPKSQRLYSLDWNPGEIYTFKCLDNNYRAFLTIEKYTYQPSKYAPAESAVYNPHMVLFDWSAPVPFSLNDLNPLPNIVILPNWPNSYHNCCYFAAGAYGIKKQTHKKYKYVGSMHTEEIEQFKISHNSKTKPHWAYVTVNMDCIEEELDRFLSYQTSTIRFLESTVSDQ